MTTFFYYALPGEVQEWLSATGGSAFGGNWHAAKQMFLGGRMAWVYVLWSIRLHKRYVGSSRKNVEARLHEHNGGRNKFTKGGIPWIILYTEKYKDFTSARKREIFLKTGAGRAWLDELISQQRSQKSI